MEEDAELKQRRLRIAETIFISGAPLALLGFVFTIAAYGNTGHEVKVNALRFLGPTFMVLSLLCFLVGCLLNEVPNNSAPPTAAGQAILLRTLTAGEKSRQKTTRDDSTFVKVRDLRGKSATLVHKIGLKSTLKLLLLTESTLQFHHRPTRNLQALGTESIILWTHLERRQKYKRMTKSGECDLFNYLEVVGIGLTAFGLLIVVILIIIILLHEREKSKYKKKSRSSHSTTNKMYEEMGCDNIYNHLRTTWDDV